MFFNRFKLDNLAWSWSDSQFFFSVQMDYSRIIPVVLSSKMMKAGWNIVADKWMDGQMDRVTNYCLLRP